MKIFSQKKLSHGSTMNFHRHPSFASFACQCGFSLKHTQPNVYILGAFIWVPLLQCKEYLSHVSIKKKKELYI